MAAALRVAKAEMAVRVRNAAKVAPKVTAVLVRRAATAAMAAKARRRAAAWADSAGHASKIRWTQKQRATIVARCFYGAKGIDKMPCFAV